MFWLRYWNVWRSGVAVRLLTNIADERDPFWPRCCRTASATLLADTVLAIIGRRGLFFGQRFLFPHRPILKRHLHSRVLTRSTIMGKIRQGNKEQKKQPLLTPKEKKSAKQAEKHASDIVPLVSR